LPNCRSRGRTCKPEALAGAAPSLYALARELRSMKQGRHPPLPGRQGCKGGQIATELLPATAKRGPVIATCELDMLLTTASPAVLHIQDSRPAGRIGPTPRWPRAFKFGWYAWLVHKNYQNLQQVTVSVWQTRLRNLTPPPCSRGGRPRILRLASWRRGGAGGYVGGRRRRCFPGVLARSRQMPHLSRPHVVPRATLRRPA